jgi:hypothetical protein
MGTIVDWFGRGTFIVFLVAVYAVTGALFALVRLRAAWQWSVVLCLGALSLGLNQDLWEASRSANGNFDEFWLYPPTFVDRSEINVPAFTVIALFLLAWIPSLAGFRLTQALRRGRH